MLRINIFILLIIFNTCLNLSAEIDFENEIKPIFKEHCIKCHGPEKQKADLRLDQRVSLLKGGDTGFPSLVPGDLKKSFIIEAIEGENEDMRMPPKGELLSREKIELIKKWVETGAHWPGQMNDSVAKATTDHWSFQNVTKPVLPHESKNPIDAFILKTLKDHELSMNEESDPQSLIKRVYVVLTGLQPSFAEVEKFKKAYQINPEQTYSNLVDELLNSKHFGERWAQHWMDVIRWAETNGSESNLYRKNAWVYRDYLIDAFNSDKPYDQFIKEQIAGDTMGEGEALGFLVSGPHVPAATVGREPSAIRQARADRMDEIMQTIGASIMGVTISCARCHNHKFDPISIKDYYSLSSIFQDIEFGSRIPELNSHDPIQVHSNQLQSEIDLKREALLKEGSFTEQWKGYQELHLNPIKTSKVRIDFHTPNYNIDEIELFAINNKEKDLALFKRGTKIKINKDLSSGSNGPYVLIDGKFGTMTHRQKAPKGSKEKPWIELSLKYPVKINRLRLSNNRVYAVGVDYMQGYKLKPVSFSYKLSVENEKGEWQVVADTKKISQRKGDFKNNLKSLQTTIDRKIEEGPQHSFVAKLIDPVKTYVFHRGSPENPKDEVMPAAPAILDGDLKLTSAAKGAKRRVEFASWLVQKSHPLTARVMVNRLWHHIFGAGLVKTTSDFGLAGAMPTHPELLDWLAHEFMHPTQMGSKAWGMKDMIRLIVMSKTFKQSSQPNEKGMLKDGGSQYLWRFPPRRVEAEVIRDGVLLASDSLNKTLGGKSYRIHNVKKTYSQWEVTDNFSSETWRRMIYQERMRRVDDKMFTAFDFPDCGTVRAKRPVSTTPLQALNLMNSDFVLKQAELIAQRSSESSLTNQEKVIKSFQYILKRSPDHEELKEGLELNKRGGLDLVCRSLLNSNEFAFLP